MNCNPLINFLRTYGPSAAADSLYDEHVQAAVREHNVQEIKMSAPLVDELGELITGESPTNVILTGTAGDGKTYHIRRVFIDYLNGNPDDWPGEDLIVSVPLPNGIQLRIIRDLSELTDAKKKEEIDHIARCLTGQDDRTIYLVAANDGQLLEMWRIASIAQPPENEPYLEVYRALSKMLRDEEEFDKTGILKLRMYNLSRCTRPETILDEAIEKILGHSMWEKGCEQCPLINNVESCPIRINRKLLMGTNNVPDSQVFRSHLRNTIELASANDQHIPLRQILTLVVNVVLGDAEDQDTPLLTCETAYKRAKSCEFKKTNPFDNAVGLNLSEDTRNRYIIFSTLESFGIGFETTNRFDKLILHQKPKICAERLNQVDEIYGDSLFKDLRKQYLNGPRERINSKVFSHAMASQRRRLFFLLPADETNNIGSEWHLTVFHNGGEYLKFKNQVANGVKDHIIDSTTRRLIKGFNRAITGLMTDDTEMLWLAQSIGISDDPTGRITTTGGTISRNSGNSLFFLEICSQQKRNRPRVIVKPNSLFKISNEYLTEIDVKPLLFEYLLRVANGSLPSSLSRQCHQEVKHLAMILQQDITLYTDADNPTIDKVQILSLDGDAAIKQNNIKSKL